MRAYRTVRRSRHLRAAASSERSRSAILCPSVDENYTTFRDDWLVLLLTDISERERGEGVLSRQLLGKVATTAARLMRLDRWTRFGCGRLQLHKPHPRRLNEEAN